MGESDTGSSVSVDSMEESDTESSVAVDLKIFGNVKDELEMLLTHKKNTNSTKITPALNFFE